MDESTNGEWFSHCGVGLISIVVFSISPAISASHRFHSAFLQLLKWPWWRSPGVLGTHYLHEEIKSGGLGRWGLKPLASWPETTEEPVTWTWTPRLFWTWPLKGTVKGSASLFILIGTALVRPFLLSWFLCFPSMDHQPFYCEPSNILPINFLFV